MENRRHFVVTKMKLRKREKKQKGERGKKGGGGAMFTNENDFFFFKPTFLINSVGVAAPEIERIINSNKIITLRALNWGHWHKSPE